MNRRGQRIVLWVLVILLTVSLVALPLFGMLLSLVRAQGSEGPGKLILVLVPDLGWEDILSPEASSWRDGFYWASANIRGPDRSRASSYATLSAGASALGVGLSSGVAANELTLEGRAADVFLRRTGVEPPPDAVLFLDMPAVQRMNQGRASYPGALGDALEEAGIPRYLFGNADSAMDQERGAPLLLSDRHGMAGMGHVGLDTLQREEEAPYGLSFHLEAFASSWQTLKEKDALVLAVEMGDLWRQRLYSPRATPAAAAAARKEALKKLGMLLSLLEKDLSPQDQLWILSPVSREDPRVAGDFLTPVGIRSVQGKGGLLYSPSTRRPGFVTGPDLTVQMLAFYRLTPKTDMVGRPLEMKDQQDGFLTAATLHDRALAVDRWRPSVLKTWIFIYLGLLILYGFFAGLAKRLPAFLQPLLLYLTAFGPAMLLAPLTPYPAWREGGGSLAIIFILSALLLGISWILGRILFREPSGPLYALSLITSLLITWDAAQAGLWTRWSYLGYSALSGARYYGIGNEMLGVWLGALLVASAGLLRRFGQRGLLLSGLLMGSAVLLLAWPQGGASFGGATSAALIFVPTLLYALQGRWRWSYALWGALGLVAVVALMVVLDLRLGKGSTHVGFLFTRVREMGLEPLIRTAVGKLMVEWRLLQLTVWTRLLLVFVGVVGTLFYVSRATLLRYWQEHPWLRAPSFGFLLSIPILLLLNDSGVVAVATSLTFITAAFFSHAAEAFSAAGPGDQENPKKGGPPASG
ncbi:MAG: hypothetical protein QJR00_03615 [Bacillota bacterium]|nr:hypothetical protein [Bacillota bacterium]